MTDVVIDCGAGALVPPALWLLHLLAAAALLLGLAA